MAQAWCTGPVHFYVGILSGYGAYLGTTEGKPMEQNEAGWEELFNDVTGGVCPYDVSQQGQQAYFGGTFTRFNENIYQAIKNYPRAGGAPGAPGIPGLMGPGDMGTLMLTEGQAYQCWMVNAYGAGSLTPKAAFAASPFGIMPGGVRYVAGWLHRWGEQKGTSPRRLILQFRAIAVYIYTGAAAGGNILYDFNISGLPAPS